MVAKRQHGTTFGNSAAPGKRGRMADLVLDENRPAGALVLDGGVVRLDGRRTVVVPVPVESLCQTPSRSGEKISLARY